MPFLGPLPRQRLYTTPRVYRQLLAGLASGVNPGAVRALEETFSKWIDARHAVAMPMARTGIYRTLRAIIRPGQDVILSPYTISDVVNMVLCAGGRPVFADIERKTWNIDASDAERLIHKETGAVLVTHFYGLACDMARMRAICARHGVPMIEDSAQALGTRSDGKNVGTLSAAGIFSFGLFKSVTSFLGGMVVTDDDALAAKLREGMNSDRTEGRGTLVRRAVVGAVTDTATYPPLFRAITYHLFRAARLYGVQALEKKFAFDASPVAKHSIPDRYLRQMTTAQAQVALSQLPQVARDTVMRIERALTYHDGLSDVADIGLPPRRSDGSHVYPYFPILVRGREDFVRFLLRRGRDIAVSHHRNCAEMPCFAEFHRACPNADRAEVETVYLPTYPRYSMDEVRRNVEAIRTYFGRA